MNDTYVCMKRAPHTPRTGERRPTGLGCARETDTYRVIPITLPTIPASRRGYRDIRAGPDVPAAGEPGLVEAFTLTGPGIEAGAIVAIGEAGRIDLERRAAGMEAQS